MSRRARKKVVANLLTGDTIYFEHNPNRDCETLNIPVYESHYSIAQDWLHGESIWEICSRFNIRVPEAELLVRHGVLMEISELKKRKSKTGSKNSKKKQPST